MNTNDLTEKLPVASAEADYDTKPLLKEIREDLLQLMRSFAESQKRADVMQENIAQFIQAFAESEKRNEAFQAEMRVETQAIRAEMRADKQALRSEIQSLRDEIHDNEVAARARHENLRLEMNQRFDRFEKKVTLMHTDILEARTDVVLLEKRIEPLEQLAQVAA